MKLGCKLFLFGLMITLLAACGSNSGNPEAVIERYIAALVEGDMASAVALSCGAWEEFANAEGVSFEGVEAALDGMDCSVINMDDTSARVTCDGNVVFSYAGGEDQLLPLNRRNYLLAFEGGSWLMCGYE